MMTDVWSWPFAACKAVAPPAVHSEVERILLLVAYIVQIACPSFNQTQVKSVPL